MVEAAAAPPQIDADMQRAIEVANQADQRDMVEMGQLGGRVEGAEG